MIVAALAALAPASPASYHECRKLNAYTWVRVDGTGCATGRAVARAIQRHPTENPPHRLGFTCSSRYGSFHGFAGSRYTCRRAGARVQVDSVGE